MPSLTLNAWDSPAQVRKLDEHLRAVDEEQAQADAQRQLLQEEFLRAASECQADKFALFANRVRDYKTREMRLQTVGEVVCSEMDYRDFGQRVAQVLLNAAAGRGSQREAQKLIEDMAAHWADMEV